MRFDGLWLCGIVEIVSSRLLREGWRASLAAWLCLVAFAGISRGQETMRSIEIVPSHSAATSNNFVQPSSSDSQLFKAWQPRAPHPYQSQQGTPASITPLPHPQAPALSDRDKELLERRKNWIFLTPEDYTQTDDKMDADSKDPRDPKKKNSDKKLTPMEKYLERLSGAQQAGGTNRLDKMDSDRMNETNYLVGGTSQKKTETDPFGGNPFSASPESTIFQTLQQGSFGSGAFSSGDNSPATPEELRAQADQKTRMDSYKQLFNFDQPSGPTALFTPGSGPIDSAPLFGVSTPTVSPGLTALPTIGNTATRAQQAPPPVVTPTRITPPPHADFSVPQRPF